MEKIRINRARFSHATWSIIFENSSIHAILFRDELFEKSLALENLRQQAKYNTGSISSGAIWALFSACLFFKPKNIAEVGTFIGKSTFAMACATDISYPNGGHIYTCDFSNKIDLEFGTKTQVQQFQMQSSTDMLLFLTTNNQKVDLLLLDGRLQGEDFKLLPNILHQESILLLDDFEGTEKGVINAIQLMNSLHRTHYLVYPPTQDLMRLHGLQESCTVGIIIPKTLVENTNQ